MKLRFVEGGGFDSKIIRHSTRCRWSHVEAISDPSGRGISETLGAQLKGGVKWRSLSDPCYRGAVAYELYAVPSTPAQESEFWKFLDEQAGKPYDWRAIAGFSLGERDWREKDSWFCSELQTRALEVAGILKLPLDIPVWRITPRDLWILVVGLNGIGRNVLPSR